MHDEKQSIVTIDGPAGVGKSTVSRIVAARAGFIYLDTGAMYRGSGFFLKEQGVDLADLDAVRNSLKSMELELIAAPDLDNDVGVIINGRDVSLEIRTPEMAMVASEVSAITIVRDILTDIQRSYGEKGCIVAEGRDIGTVVFPKAAYKFFLDAAPEERARRRVVQLKERGKDADYNEILTMILERDKNDRERAIAPLKKAEDALLIDTTKISVNEVVGIILERIGQ